MADDVDMAVEIADEHLARGIERARQPIPAGVPGECEQCFEDSPRLVGGRCAFCRDGRRRPLNPIGKQSTPTPAPTEEEPMPAKSVQLPASADVAIACLEEHARGNNLSLGNAAAELIERGAATVTAPDAPSSEALSLDDLIRLIRERFDERPDQSAELAAAIERAETAEALLTTAEGKLDQLKALIA